MRSHPYSIIWGDKESFFKSLTKNLFKKCITLLPRRWIQWIIQEDRNWHTNVVRHHIKLSKRRDVSTDINPVCLLNLILHSLWRSEASEWVYTAPKESDPEQVIAELVYFCK